MRKFFGKFVSVTLAAVVIAMFALSSDDKWCSRVDKAFDESALGSFLNESKAGYGRYATGLPGQAASVLADSGKNGENGGSGENGVMAMEPVSFSMEGCAAGAGQKNSGSIRHSGSGALRCQCSLIKTAA